MKTTYTQHKLKSDWLKALARAKLLVDDGKVGHLFGLGLGYGSAMIRAALANRGLIDQHHIITDAGIDAVVQARKEGW